MIKVCYHGTVTKNHLFFLPLGWFLCMRRYNEQRMSPQLAAIFFQKLVWTILPAWHDVLYLNWLLASSNRLIKRKVDEVSIHCWFTGKLRRGSENERHCSLKSDDLMLLVLLFISSHYTLTLVVHPIGQSSNRVASQTGLWYISILTLGFWSSVCLLSNVERKSQ